jgi:acetylornithine/succinyldiaminopimelate/putrescine aminotransferase
MRAAVDGTVAAVLIESVQGEGGVNPATTDYLQGIRQICDETGALLMIDEIQTGFARTGKWFGFEHAGVRPDVVTLAKAMGNGMPVGACWARTEVAAVFQPGDHGSTYGGNPLATAVARKVLEIMDRDNMADRAAALGVTMTAALSELPRVDHVRGMGAMLAVEFEGEIAKDVASRSADAGLLVIPITPTALRLTPPLTTSDAEVEEAVAILRGVLSS